MIATNITTDYCTSLAGNHTTLYYNSIDGRAKFAAECADCENYAEVMQAWGDTPTVTEVVPEPEPAVPTPQEQTDALMLDHEERIIYLELGVNENAISGT